jgi:SseB protein N-terminal domain
MFRFLHKLFRRRDALAEAGRRTSCDAFVQSIGAADLFVFAAMRSDGLDAATFTQEELLAEIERTALDLSEREEFEPFIYQRDGETCLPFFSSPNHYERFVGEYSKSRNRVFGFQVLGVNGGVIAKCAKGVERLVLNDWTSDERPLSDDERRLLQETRGTPK